MRLVADPATERWLIGLTGADRDLEWDSGNLTKNRKHGVEPGDIQALIGGEFYFAGRIIDPPHTERRWLALGEDAAGRRLALIFTAARQPTATHQLSRHAAKGESAL